LKKRLAMMLAVVLILSAGVFSYYRRVNTTNVNVDIPAKQKVIVVAVDKETKAPVKDAKIYIVGHEQSYVTDEMGKTQEILVDINKDYFKKYIDEVSNKISCGFLNIVVNKDGYGKHFEIDYSVFPGNSAALVKIELTKGKKDTVKCNTPDVTYIENLVRGYEKFEGEQTRSDQALKYKVTVVDEANKPLEGVKVVVPEAKITSNTDKKGSCEIGVLYDDNSLINYPVKKTYGEITVLTYKDGYSSKALLKAHISKDGKDNSITVKLSKAKKAKIEYELVKPGAKWAQDIINSYKE
jgi:hypothetical protein